MIVQKIKSWCPTILSASPEFGRLQPFFSMTPKTFCQSSGTVKPAAVQDSQSSKSPGFDLPKRLLHLTPDMLAELAHPGPPPPGASL